MRARILVPVLTAVALGTLGPVHLQAQSAVVEVWGSCAPIASQSSSYPGGTNFGGVGGGYVGDDAAAGDGSGNAGGGPGANESGSGQEWKFVRVISTWAHKEKRYVAHDIKKNWDYEITLKDCTVELSGTINSSFECNLSVAKLAVEGNISVEISIGLKAGFKFDLPKRRQALSKLYGKISELSFLEQNIGLQLTNNGIVRKAAGYETEFATYPVEQDLGANP